eukprot:8870273-Pyramimonas_sp.AAC.1
MCIRDSRRTAHEAASPRARPQARTLRRGRTEEDDEEELASLAMVCPRRRTPRARLRRACQARAEEVQGTAGDGGEVDQAVGMIVEM